MKGKTGKNWTTLKLGHLLNKKENIRYRVKKYLQYLKELVYRICEELQINKKKTSQ